MKPNANVFGGDITSAVRQYGLNYSRIVIGIAYRVRKPTWSDDKTNEVFT